MSFNNKQHVQNLRRLLSDLDKNHTMPTPFKRALRNKYKKDLKEALKHEY